MTSSYNNSATPVLSLFNSAEFKNEGLKKKANDNK